MMLWFPFTIPLMSLSCDGGWAFPYRPSHWGQSEPSALNIHSHVWRIYRDALSIANPFRDPEGCFNDPIQVTLFPETFLELYLWFLPSYRLQVELYTHVLVTLRVGLPARILSLIVLTLLISISLQLYFSGHREMAFKKKSVHIYFWFCCTQLYGYRFSVSPLCICWALALWLWHSILSKQWACKLLSVWCSLWQALGSNYRVEGSLSLCL